jgi:Transglycosylase SLT domain
VIAFRRGLGSTTYAGTIASLQPTYCPSCPPSLVTALVNMESGGNQYGPSGAPLTSSAGAIGLFQLMPATAAGLNVDPTNPTQNIQGGLTLLQQLYNQYGDWNTALEAYNEGGGNLAKQLAAGQTPASAGYASSILSAAGIDSSISLPSLSLDPSTDSPSDDTADSSDTASLLDSLDLPASLDLSAATGLSWPVLGGIAAGIFVFAWAINR